MNKKFALRFAIIILMFGLFASFSQTTTAATVLIWNQERWPAEEDMSGLCLGGGPINIADVGNLLEFRIPSAFDTSGLTISDTESESEVEIYLGHTDCTGTARVAEATETADNNRELVTLVDGLLTIKWEDVFNQTFSIKFVEKTDVNSSTIIAPVAGNYFMAIFLAQSGEPAPRFSGGDFIYIGYANEVNISASVDPTLTFELSDTSCALGTMTPSDIKTCQYSTTVSTNASAGYTSYIKADGEFRKGSDSIAYVADGAVTAGGDGAGHGEYGVSQTNGAGGLDIDRLDTPTAGYCTSLNDQHTYEASLSSALSTSDQSYALSLGPVDAEETTLCHAVGINASTPAGTYSQLVTLTIIANF